MITTVSSTAFQGGTMELLQGLLQDLQAYWDALPNELRTVLALATAFAIPLVVFICSCGWDVFTRPRK